MAKSTKKDADIMMEGSLATMAGYIIGSVNSAPRRPYDLSLPRKNYHPRRKDANLSGLTFIMGKMAPPIPPPNRGVVSKK